MINKTKKILINILLFLVTLLVIFALFETGIRVTKQYEKTIDYWPEEKKVYNPTLKRVLFCDVENLTKSTSEYSYVVNTNELCFRDNHPIKKPPETFRILVLGDSFIFGNTVNYENTIPYLLEKELKNKLEKEPSALQNQNKKIEVINLGMGGFSTTEEFLVFKEYGVKYEPNLILVGFYMNDFQDSLNFKKRESSRKTTVEKVIFKSKFVNWAYWSLKTSPSGNRLINTIGLNLNTQNAHQFELSLLQDDFLEDPEIKEAIALTRISLRDIKELSEEIDSEMTKLIVFYIPAKWQIYDESFELMKKTYGSESMDHEDIGHRSVSYESVNLNQPQEILSSFLKKEEIIFIDFTSELEKVNSEELYWEYDWHLNQKGYFLLANLLSERVVELLSPERSFEEENS